MCGWLMEEKLKLTKQTELEKNGVFMSCGVTEMEA